MDTGYWSQPSDSPEAAGSGYELSASSIFYRMPQRRARCNHQDFSLFYTAARLLHDGRQSQMPPYIYISLKERKLHADTRIRGPSADDREHVPGQNDASSKRFHLLFKNRPRRIPGQNEKGAYRTLSSLKVVVNGTSCVWLALRLMKRPKTY